MWVKAHIISVLQWVYLSGNVITQLSFRLAHIIRLQNLERLVTKLGIP